MRQRKRVYTLLLSLVLSIAMIMQTSINSSAESAAVGSGDDVLITNPIEQTEEEIISDYEEMGLQAPSEEALNSMSSDGRDKVVAQMKKAKTNDMVSNTRTYGFAIYIGTMDGVNNKMSKVELMSRAESYMKSGAYIKCVGYEKAGGTVGELPATLPDGTTSRVVAIDGQPSAQFQEVLFSLDPAIAQQFATTYAEFANGNGTTLPFICYTPCLAVNNGAPVSLMDIAPGYTVVSSYDDVIIAGQLLEQATGSTMGTTMLTGEGLGAGLSVVNGCTLSSYTGNYVLSGLAVPSEQPGEPKPGTFYVTASPYNAPNVWSITPEVTGIYKLNMNIPMKDIADKGLDGFIDITIKANFSDNTLGNAPNAVLQKSSVEVTLQNPSKWLDNPVITYSLAEDTSTIRIPSTHVNLWNDYGGLVYTVKIKGGSDTKVEQARPASFFVNVEGTDYPASTDFIGDDKWKAIGTRGINYTSWTGNITSSFDIGYDKHTVNIPHGESLVVANTAKDSEASWDASIGIPSTENVSVKTGAEAGMADIYGYLCARPYSNTDPYTVANTTAQGVDETGVKNADQAVTRTITVKGQVTNCWGSNNPVCQLSDASKVVKSNNLTQDDGAIYNPAPATCSGHSCGSGSVGGGTYLNPWHKATLYRCTNHFGGYPGWPTYDEQHPGNCGGSSENIQTDEDGNVISRSCACSSCSSGSVSTNSHNCSFNVTVHDSVGEEYLGQNIPLTGSASGVNSTAGSYGLITISNPSQSGIDIHWKISWKPSVDKQYYIVTYDVWNVNRESGASGCNGTSRGGQGNVAWGANGTHYTGTWPESDTVLCQDYTHGTGYNTTDYENMVHQGTHNYTITYKETIDSYAYKTIENATVFNLKNIVFKDVHQIERNSFTDVLGNEWEAGTFPAPISNVAIGRSVSAPESVGYLWRCVGSGEKHGEYISGNGRILFEAWKSSVYTNNNWGNVTVERPDNYFLGDVTVTIKAVQDSAWGNSLSAVDTWDPLSSKAGITKGGVAYDHIHDYAYQSLNDYQPNCADSKFLSITTGDCTTESGVKTKTDNSGEHGSVVQNELMAILNAWSGYNSGLSAKTGGQQLYYKANIISDTMVYGGTKLTNSLIEDSYAVDGVGDGPGFGVPLFNLHSEPRVASTAASINENLGTKEAYRSHKNAYSNGSKSDLMLKLKGDYFSTASVGDGMSMEMFGGISGYHEGGTKSLAETTAGQMMSSFSTFGFGCSGTKGEAISGTAYMNILSPDANHNNDTSGMTTLTVTTKGSVSEQNFAGYWKDFKYKTIGSGETESKVNNTISGTGHATDFGLACLNEYGTLAISNLPLVDWTPNGSVYTGEVAAEYTENTLANSTIPPKVEGTITFDPRTDIQETHVLIANGRQSAPCGSNGSNYLNAIKIYNPVSAEFDWVIGAQYGKFEESNTVSDDRELDQRLDDEGNYLKEKSDYATTTKPYVVQSQYLWSWVTPFGNFDSFDDGVSGHGNDTADKSLSGTGAIIRNSGYKGYVDNMNVNKWILTKTIAYPFVAGISDYESTTKPFVELKISGLRQAHPGSGGAIAGPAKNSKLDDTESDKEKFLWGNAFSATNTCNIVESDMDNPTTPTTYVYYRVYGINPFTLTNDSYMLGEAKGSYIESELNNAGGTRLANKAYKRDKVNLVGSIGNVSVHDTEDFRFSNYFKEPTTDWLIDGVIHEVDYMKPKRIVSSYKDICYNEVTTYIENGTIYNLNGTKPDSATMRGHDTLGTTMYTRDASYGGMAGYFDMLPLVPSYNTVPEYRTEAVRLGYKAFMSVDTIGQYKSLLDDVDAPSGPGDKDTREQYLTVRSEYYLYDFDDGKFYDIDVWSGSTGGKERLYNGLSKTTEQISNAGSIYQKPYVDRYRRNIGVLETGYTDIIIRRNQRNEAAGKIVEYSIVYSNDHYIGQPGLLKLDTRDLTYIGSSNNNSEGRYWGKSSIDAFERSDNAQRYHFKDGLTSTTVLTEPLGDNPTQAEIEMANRKVKEEHPHSVLIQFMDFIAKGEVWTIRCNGSMVNQPTFTVYDTNGDDPDDPDDDTKYVPKDWDPVKVAQHNVISYQGAKTYNPVTNTESGTIDKDLTPVVVYEAYHTSADDRTVAGTH